METVSTGIFPRFYPCTQVLSAILSCDKKLKNAEKIKEKYRYMMQQSML
jgi:hypothetical protein